MTPAPRHFSHSQREQAFSASPGALVARVLRGAWRGSSPTVREGASTIQSPKFQAQNPISEAELTEITPILCRNGSGALAWYKIQNTPLANTAAGEQLHEVYRRFRLAALVHEREIAYVFSLLRAAGIEAVLVKGWAIARRYPDPALRPYGDIDLCVAPQQFGEAQRALRCLESIEGHHVDLHAGFEEVGRTKAVQSPGPSRPWTLDIGLWTESVECGGEPVRILCDEDHLGILSLHLLRSGAWRPVWLCDIALLLEQNDRRPPTADRRSGTDDGRQTTDDDLPRSAVGGRPSFYSNWVRTTIALAQELLGAGGDVPSPKSEDQNPLPRWLVPAVLKQWGRSKHDRRPATADRGESSSVVRRPSSVPLFDLGHWTSLYSRWDNPIRATAAVGGEFNNWPRLPYRVAESFMRLREGLGSLTSGARQVSDLPARLDESLRVSDPLLRS